MASPADVGLPRACRACLGSDFAQGTRLTSDGWRDLYQFCVHTEIPEQQVASATLCAECSMLVQQFAKFKRTCQQSETFWRDSQWTQNLEYGVIPLACPVYKHDEKPMKVEIAETATNVKDEANDDDTVFEDDFNSECRLSEVKAERQDSTKRIKNTQLTTKIYLKTYDTLSKLDVEQNIAKPKKHSVTRQEKKKKCEKEKFFCNECGAGYTTKLRLANHIKRQHETFLFCGLCEYKASDAPSLRQHFEQHFVNNDLKCTLCQFEGRDFADMVGHRLQHQGRSVAAGERAACPLCGAARGRGALAAEFHVRQTHLGARGGRCHHCGKRFATLKKWRTHELFHRSGVQCHVPLCRKWFHTQEALAAHLAAHPAPERFVCDHCGRIFAKKSNLTFCEAGSRPEAVSLARAVGPQLHVRSVHAARAAAACGHCARVFAQPHYLARHLRDVARARRHACTRCPRTFARRAELASHARAHEPARPFACHLCARRYKRKASLVSHLKTHSGERAAQCGACPAAFYTASQLARHAASHSGRRRHGCALCPRSFHEARLLQRHRLKAHPAAHRGSDASTGRDDSHERQAERGTQNESSRPSERTDVPFQPSRHPR